MAKLGRCDTCDSILMKSTGQTPEGKPLEVYVCPVCTQKAPGKETIVKATDKWGLEPLQK